MPFRYVAVTGVNIYLTLWYDNIREIRFISIGARKRTFILKASWGRYISTVIKLPVLVKYIKRIHTPE